MIVVLPNPASPTMATVLTEEIRAAMSSKSQFLPITSSRPTEPGCSNRSGLIVSLSSSARFWLWKFAASDNLHVIDY